MAGTHTYILGLNTYDHDVSACLLRDGEIAVAIAKERITREKQASGFFQEVVDYCLAAEGIGLDQVSLVVRNCYILPVPEMESRLVTQEAPLFLNERERRQAAKHPLFLATSDKVVTVSHHLAHAYSAFAACPFEDGVVMVVDGVGSYSSDISEPWSPAAGVAPLARESESYYRFEGSRIEALEKVWLEPARGFLSDEFHNMPGIGALYSRAATYVFGDWSRCGELMGLAPYGRAGEMAPFMDLDGGKLRVPVWSSTRLDQPWLSESEGGDAWEDSPSMQHWKDLARQVQDDTERVLLARAAWLRETTGARNLCLAGGVALNCVANGRIAREAGFDNVWIQPAAGDDGIAIGCAFYGHLAIMGRPRSYVMRNAYLGAAYGEEDIAAATEKRLVRLATRRRHSPDICADTASVLAEGHVVAWFQGRSELGPRALGNRSILADPRAADMKATLNSRVKHRQAFRPFAPIVLAERAGDIFESDEPSPYMLITKRVRAEWRHRIPAVVHVDGSARVQTVDAATNPVLYRLLKEFDALTGVPVLVNTSFNVKGEPIVETPQDAMACFLETGIDYLVLHDFLIGKSALHKVLTPIIRIYSDVGARVRAAIRA